GRRIRAIVLRTARRRAVGEIERLTLADGRTVVASPRHPTADGRLVGALQVGDRFGGSRVRAISTVPYRGFTYDLLPSGPTGGYSVTNDLIGIEPSFLVNSALMGATERRAGTSEAMPPQYDAKAAEARWYDEWAERGYFHPEPSDREPYCIVLPPPNVTGALH